MVIAAVPVAAPPVVRTRVVLADVTVAEVAVKAVTGLLAMEVTVPKKYPAGMVRVMVPPMGTVVAGMNTRTGETVAPDTWEPTVMDVKAVIVVGAAVMARASLPEVKKTSVLTCDPGVMESKMSPVMAAAPKPGVR
jgi:hypothetical protein